MKLTQLTFTRFIAAISIVIFHFKDQTFPFNIAVINEVVSYLDVLVTYFFALSGFILLISIDNKINIKQYLLKRFARVYPLYLFSLLLTLLLIYNARTPKDTISFDKVFLTLTLIQSWFEGYQLIYNFPAWSLSVEAFLYLLFPFIILTFKKIDIKWEVALVVVFWVIMQLLYFTMIKHGKYYATYNPVFHIATFLLGITTGKIFQNNLGLLNHYVKQLEIISLFLLIILVYLIKSENEYFKLYYQAGLLAPAFVVFILTVALTKRKFILLFNNIRLQYLGEISYGIYILQIPASILVAGMINRTIKVSPTSSFYIYLVFLLLFSAITYEIIEKPCRSFLRYSFSKSNNNRRVTLDKAASK